ncbi:hypothetical protein OJAV_G00139660 [Oryzias javanicus]|uniref:Uncharacterized protein n=1 Tax=Oryzias javanicus TaxID=123683 RepID=A0A3S2PDB5_ORYJA|nr:hypothetical protein OJAV_G00139660 [Oryzias javanicus]
MLWCSSSSLFRRERTLASRIRGSGGFSESRRVSSTFASLLLSFPASSTEQACCCHPRRTVLEPPMRALPAIFSPCTENEIKRETYLKKKRNQKQKR